MQEAYQGISSTPSAVLYRGRGYPIPAGGTPSQVPPNTDLTGGYPIPAGGRGYPISGGWYPIPAGGYPISGTPCPDLARGYPILVHPHPDLAGGGVPTHPDLGGVPPIGPGWGTPHLDLAGVPPVGPGQGTPHLDLAGVPPPGPGRGTPQVWTDKQSENITSRLLLRTRSVIKVILLISNFS